MQHDSFHARKMLQFTERASSEKIVHRAPFYARKMVHFRNQSSAPAVVVVD
jgi:hypothetical protein